MRPLASKFTLVFIVIIGIDASSVFAGTQTWDDGDPNDSFWDSNQNWSDDTQPGPADDAVVGGNPEVNTTEIFSELDNSGTIDITTGTLQPNDGTVNGGTINVGDGSAIVSQFNPGSLSSISGSGEVVLMNSDNVALSRAVITGGSNSSVPVTNGANHTIRGEGTIQLHWINDGIVRAEETTGDSSAALYMDNMSFVNNGELRSSAGASIFMNNVVYSQGVGGQLIADTDGMFFSGVNTVLSGGSLESVGGGSFNQLNINSATTLSGIVLNAPFNAIMTAGSGDLVGTSSGITNNSVITLDGQAAGAAELRFSSAGTIDGSGEVVLAGETTRSLVTAFVGITQGVNHTIRGAGRINGNSLVNNGTILAQALTESVLSQNSDMTNNGLMQADSGATLRFESSASAVQGPSGVIAAADGGTVELRTASITGGSLETTGSGVITMVAQDAVFSDLTITAGSNVAVPAGLRLNWAGSGITNNGTVTLNSNSINSVSTLEYDSSLTLDGAGEIVINTVGNQIARIRNGGGDHTLTQAAGHTIRGDGWLIGSVVNNGSIEGDSPTEPIVVFSSLSGTGTLKDVVINGSFSVDFGIHSPGNSTTIADIDGSYAIQGLGRLVLEVGGLTPGTEHDQLDGSGDPNSAISLGGTLDVLALDTGSYTPTAGDRFQIIQSSNPISGTFSSVNFPEYLGGREVTWLPVDYSTDPNAVSLEIASVDFFDADFDEDGDVDNDDLTNWQTGYGTLGAGHTDGDANGDGLVTGADFLIWQEQFGLGVSSLLVNSVPVPEPGAATLLCVGCLFCGFRRR